MSFRPTLGVTQDIARYPYSPSNNTAFSLAQALGMKYFRMTIPWNYLSGSWNSLFNTGGGSYNTTSSAAISTIITAAAAYGLTPIFVIDGCIAPAGSYPTNPQYQTNYPITAAQFASCMAWLVGQCPGQHWEIINEPDEYQDGSGAQLDMTPANYVPALQAAYTAMKAADSTCKVHLGPVANINNGGSGYEWLLGCYEAGVVGSYDVFSFHLYPYPGNLTWQNSETGNLATQITGALASLRSTYSDTTPMWMTETGWVSSGSGAIPDMNVTTQAINMYSWLLEISNNLTGIAVVMIFALQDGGDGNWGLVDSTNTPKLVYGQIKSLFTNVKGSIV